MIRFEGISLEDDFSRATHADGKQIALTRGEALVLGVLVRHGGRVVTRSQILDDLSGVGSEKSDRNVDFTVNRLRRKLDDNSRAPRFIATRYGEGYAWLPRQTGGKPPASGAYVVVGPVRGLHHTGDHAGLAHRFLDLFHLYFARNVGGDRTVVLDPSCPPPSAFTEGAPEIGVDVTFLPSSEGLDCVLHAASFRKGTTYGLGRHRIPVDQLADDSLRSTAKLLADSLAADLWKGLTLTASRREPLAVAMHNAAQSLQGGLQGWVESQRRLQDLSAQNPDDPAIKLMLAINIHSKYVQNGLEIFAAGPDTRAADEAEIEALVTANLPYVQHDPFLGASAAKLLYFVSDAYRPTALHLIEEIYRSTAVVAPVLVTLGTLRAFDGRIAEGLAALDQALDLAEAGSELEVYILCLQCQVHMAVDNRKALDRVLKRLYALKPSIQFLYDILYGPGDIPTPQAGMAMQHMTLAQARAILVFADYLCGRMFRDPLHRRNTLRIPLAILGSKFGAEIASAVPDLPAETA